MIDLNKAKQGANLNNKIPEELGYYLNQDAFKMMNNVIKYWHETPESLLKDLAIKSLTLIGTSSQLRSYFQRLEELCLKIEINFRVNI